MHRSEPESMPAANNHGRPSKANGRDNKDIECPICFDVLACPVVRPACHHVFCAVCDLECRKSSPLCPCCKQPDPNGRPAVVHKLADAFAVKLVASGWYEQPEAKAAWHKHREAGLEALSQLAEQPEVLVPTGPADRRQRLGLRRA